MDAQRHDARRAGLHTSSGPLRNYADVASAGRRFTIARVDTRSRAGLQETRSVLARMAKKGRPRITVTSLPPREPAAGIVGRQRAMEAVLKDLSRARELRNRSHAPTLPGLRGGRLLVNTYQPPSYTVSGAAQEQK